jgi:hypothetical protein
MGWRENGEALRAHWHKKIEGIKRELLPPRIEELADRLSETMARKVGRGWAWTIASRRPDIAEPEFLDALDASSQDDMSPLAAYLASEKPLGPKERERLAKFLPKPAKMGRPKNHQLRGAAKMAVMFYREWRSMNQRMGTKDHGHADEMKCYAVEAVVEDLFTYNKEMEKRSPQEFEDFTRQVRELMDKQKSLREEWEKGLITVPLKSAKTTG